MAKRLASGRKRARQSMRRHARNKPKRTQLRSALKRMARLRTKRTALKRFVEIQSVIDKSAQDGIIHRNAAARLKSRLLKRISRLK